MSNRFPAAFQHFKMKMKWKYWLVRILWKKKCVKHLRMTSMWNQTFRGKDGISRTRQFIKLTPLCRSASIKPWTLFKLELFFFLTEFHLLPPFFFFIISSVDIIDKRSTFIFVLKRLFNLQGQSGEDQKGTENCRPDKQRRVFSWTCFLRGAQTLFFSQQPHN